MVQNRTELLMVKLTPKEKELIKEKAEKEDLRLSDYVRKRILK